MKNTKQEGKEALEISINLLYLCIKQQPIFKDDPSEMQEADFIILYNLIHTMYAFYFGYNQGRKLKTKKMRKMFDHIEELKNIITKIPV